MATDQEKQPEIDERKSVILRTIVDSYIQSASPVASKMVGVKSGLDVSVATIRNDMHVLEEAGYLTHTHTSSGRIPTEQGYRFFVDNYIKSNAVHRDHRITEIFKAREDLAYSHVQLESLMAQTAQALSAGTSHTAVVIKDEKPIVCVSDVHTSLLADGRIVVAFIMDDSSIERIVVEASRLGFVSHALSDDLLTQWNNQLKKAVLTHRIDVLPSEIAHVEPASDAMTFLAYVIAEMSNEYSRQFRDARVHLSGVAHIANESTRESDRETQIRLLALLEQQMELVSVVRKSLDESIVARIGSENVLRELHQHSMVIAPFGTSGGESGAVGIIGPTRMDYRCVFSHLDAASSGLSDILD